MFPSAAQVITMSVVDPGFNIRGSNLKGGGGDHLGRMHRTYVNQKSILPRPSIKHRNKDIFVFILGADRVLEQIYMLIRSYRNQMEIPRADDLEN